MLALTGLRVGVCTGVLLCTVAGVVLLRQPTADARSARNLDAPAKLRPPAELTPPPATPPADPRFARLWPIEFVSLNGGSRATLRLYDDQGNVDQSARAQLDELLADHRDSDHVETAEMYRRTVQLLFRAAYHFDARRVEIVSGYRKPGKRREGLHAQGRAIDFKLHGVPPAKVAAYLRTLPRVGVGIYTHRRTQFVHLDSRETSFHWLDASPPGKHWRERSLRTKNIPLLDRAYTSETDLPERLPAQL